MNSGSMRSFVQQIIQILTLNPTVFDEFVTNKRLVWPGLLIVLASGAAGIVGQYLSHHIAYDAFFNSLLRGTLVWTVSWPVVAGITYAVGRWLLGGKGKFASIVSGLGWSFTPGLLQITMSLPILGFVAFAVPMVWIITIGIAATSRILRLSSVRAMIAVLVAWGAWLLVGLVVILAQGMFPTWTS